MGRDSTMHFHGTNSSLAVLRAMILKEHPEATASRAIKVLEACILPVAIHRFFWMPNYQNYR